MRFQVNSIFILVLFVFFTNVCKSSNILIIKHIGAGKAAPVIIYTNDTLNIDYAFKSKHLRIFNNFYVPNDKLIHQVIVENDFISDIKETFFMFENHNDTSYLDYKGFWSIELKIIDDSETTIKLNLLGSEVIRKILNKLNNLIALNFQIEDKSSVAFSSFYKRFFYENYMECE